jgi:hypothetical protein
MSITPTVGQPINKAVKIQFGIKGSDQESSFMNATLTSLESGQAISIALTPPPALDLSDKPAFRNSLKTMFAGFAAAGWTIEIQAGRDDCDA